MTTLDYAKARELMVEQQIRPWDVLSPRVLEVLSAMPREHFIPDAHRNLAYADVALPLGPGRFALKPVIEGRVLQALDVASQENVLVVGAANGYLAACLGRLASEVVAIEADADLARFAREKIALLGLTNVRVEQADPFSWGSDRRFDAVCVTGAVARIPAPFLRWLKPSGRMFIVHGRAPAMEAALVRGGDVNAMQAESLFETDIPYLAGAEPVPEFKL